jgi:hypothetical protein
VRIVQQQPGEDQREDTGMSYARYARNRRRNERYRARYEWEKKNPTTPAQKLLGLAVLGVIVAIVAIVSAVSGHGNGCETDQSLSARMNGGGDGTVTCNGKVTAYVGYDGKTYPLSFVNQWNAAHDVTNPNSMGSLATPPWEQIPGHPVP